MTKTEFVDKFAGATELSKVQAAEVYAAFIETLLDGLAADGKVLVSGLGTFTVKNTAAREGRNPKTGAAVQIAASSKVAFKMASTLKGTL